MQWYEILIIVVAAAFVVGVAVWSVVRRKKGKTDCGCGCSGCAGCSLCNTAKKDDEKTK